MYCKIKKLNDAMLNESWDFITGFFEQQEDEYQATAIFIAVIMPGGIFIHSCNVTHGANAHISAESFADGLCIITRKFFIWLARSNYSSFNCMYLDCSDRARWCEYWINIWRIYFHY